MANTYFIMKKLLSFLISCLVSFYAIGNSPLVFQDGNNPTLHVDFDECVSWFNGYNEDYSEFTALSLPVENCSSLEMAGPGYVYRNNSKENIHSCTPGIDSTSLGMCITAFDNCNYMAGDSTSLIFEVKVIPGAIGMGSLEEISFYEKAPEMFNFFQGQSGTNNYPTKFGIRVLVDGTEVYQEGDINTEREWNLRTFNFSDVEAFTVTKATVFQFEILPYCLVGNGSLVQAWDIDNLTITAGCNNVNAGFVKVLGNVNICQDDTLDHTLTFEIEDAFGPNLTWMILDQQGEIVLLPNGNIVDFDTLDNGIYAIYHLAYGDDIDGLSLGNTLEDIEGCFDLSSRIVIVNNKLEAGDIQTTDGELSFQICSEEAAPNIVELIHNNKVGIQTNYFLLSDAMEILEVSLSPIFDLVNYDAGNYSIVAVTHNGQLLNAIPGNIFNQVQGCIAISNFVTIQKEFISGGTVTINSNLFCLTDSIADILTASVDNATGNSQQFIITNADSTIISVPTLPLDLDGVAPGECLVWNVSSFDSLAIEIDSKIDEISGGCYDLSNAAAFSRQDNNAGSLNIGGSTVFEICIADSLTDIAVVSVEGSSGSNYTFVITDTLNVVISSTDMNSIDFSNAPAGVCRVWGVAHDGSFSIEEGDTFSNSLAIGCTSISSEFVQVNRFDDGPVCGIFPCEVEGGFIDLFGSTYCVGDGVSDIVTGDVQGQTGPVQQIIVTGADSIIIALPGSLSFDVDTAPAGICIVWNLASNDSIPLMLGMNINTIQNECFDLSEGASFTRITNNAGSVSLTNGMTLDTICAGDNIQNALAFTTMNTVSDSFQYVITNEANTILALPMNNSFNFDVLPFGICRVYGIAYSGAFLPEVGDSLMFDPAPSGCFDISENFVTVIKENCSTSVDAGSILLAGGATEYCPGDSTGMTTMSGYEFHNFSLNLTGGISEVDIDNDIYPDYIMSTDKFIWVEYDLATDNVTLTEIHDAGEFIALFECTDIDLDGDVDIIYSPSSSPNKVNLLINDGAMNFVLTTIDADVQMISSINATDLDNDGDVDIVIAARDFNTVDEIRFYENDGSINFVYTVIDTVDLLWDTEVSDFDDNGEQDIVVSSLGSDLFIYMNPITSDEIITIDDAASGESRCKILDYDDDGDLDVTAISSGNMYLYTNNSGSYDKTLLVQFVSGVLYDIDDFDNDGDNDIIADGGFFLNNGDDTFTQEPIGTGMLHNIFSDVNGDGNLDIIYAGQWIENVSGGYLFDVIVNGSPLGTLRWVLTNDQGAIVSVLDQDPPLTFDLSPIGAYDLYQIAYDGVITGLTVGENIGNISGDFDLSNIIVLNSAPCVDECLVDGGFIDLFGSQYCVGDGEADFVTGEVISEAGAMQQIIVTDIDSVILALHDTLNFDVDSAPGGSCIVWNLASNDTITLTTGIHINTIQNSCFDLSQGASFTRIFNNGGDVSVSGGGTSIDICVGDGTADEITFATTGDGISYQYIVTDSLNVILALPDSTVVDFEGSPSGECRVWGLATDSVFSGSIGDTLVEPEIAGRCFDLSSNFVTVQRFDTDGPCGTIGNNPPLTIVLNRIGESSQIFDIKNISNDTIDVTDYWICKTGNIYNRIGVTTVECGSFNNLMAPGEVKGLNLSISNTDGELAIYNAADFDNPNAMIHYVEWGSTGHGRSDEAIAADLWSTGDFVETITPQQSIYFAGAGYSSDSWNEGNTNICGDYIVDASIVFSRVSDSGQIIDLENISDDTIDINDYEISQGFNSYRVGDLVVECGNASRILNPGDKVGLVVFPMSNVAGELALYTTTGNATFGIVSDYVQWGDAGFPNESRAVFSGVWTAGAFVPSFTSGQSIYYDGEGDEVSDWTEGATTICGSLEANKKRIDVRISPNPAIDMISIKIMDTQRPVTEMQVVNGNGKIIVSAQMEMNNNDIYQMGINDLAPGIYFLRMKSSNAVITERFMVVK